MFINVFLVTLDNKNFDHDFEWFNKLSGMKRLENITHTKNFWNGTNLVYTSKVSVVTQFYKRKFSAKLAELPVTTYNALKKKKTLNSKMLHTLKVSTKWQCTNSKIHKTIRIYFIYNVWNTKNIEKIYWILRKLKTMKT